MTTEIERLPFPSDSELREKYMDEVMESMGVSLNKAFKNEKLRGGK